jgi:hypothetical protein
MNTHYVGTVDVEPSVTLEEKELIENLPIDENIENRFPFNDIERNKVELYKIGSQQECQDYINIMDESIQYLYTVYSYN